MHNFVVHSNESVCKKMDVLGWTKSYNICNKKYPNENNISRIHTHTLNMVPNQKNHTWQLPTVFQDPEGIHYTGYRRGFF